VLRGLLNFGNEISR